MITIDPYHSIAQYLEAIQALRNNKIEYEVYVHSKSPFNWYIDIPDPYLMNYDVLPDAEQKLLVNTVKAITPSEQYIYNRKEALSGSKAFKFYTLNEPLRLAGKSDYACFFNIRNREQGVELSKSLGDIWYFGKYYNNYRIALCTNKMITNFVDSSDILVTKRTTILQMELDLNFKIFRLKDRLKKFSETPVFRNGKLKAIKNKQFNLTI